MDDRAEPTLELMRNYEQKAEAAYAAMYDAPSWDEKDLKDDAARLKARVENIMGVYNSQFRGNFR